MGLRVIITGASGMVGEGVARQCIESRAVEKILIVGRRSAGIRDPKVTEIILQDMFNPERIEHELRGYNACFFCLGVSSIGMKEQEFSHIAYDLTMGFAAVLHRTNPDLTFCYVSGSGTDSSERGRVMWARVKGRTENALLSRFRNGYMFRPGYMQPDKNALHTLKYYRYFRWMYPALRVLFPRFVSTLSELGKAMLACALKGYNKRVLEVRDIVKQAATV